MKQNKVLMTAEGYQNLQEKLAKLRSVKRPVALRNLQEMSGSADWRENSQIIHFQNELAQIDAEIRQTEEMLKQSEVVELQSQDKIVDVGETVVLQINDTRETYTIVSPAESAPEQGRISYESPLGRALLKREVGDNVEVEAPAGTIQYRIVSINQGGNS